MKIKELFNDKKKILKFTIISTGILIVLVLATIGITWGTSLPKFCATCHIMNPEFATWQASSHSQVDCTTCHVDPGLASALKHKVVATKELYKYVTKTYELPIQPTELIPDSRCLQCHSLDRKISSTYPDLNIPHQRHNTKGISCVKCHQGVAHGKVASSGLTMGGDLSKWDKNMGAQLMTVKNTVPEMGLCMDCHGRRGVTVACEACHSGNMKPESHQKPAFKTDHGQQAKQNIKNCDTCHAFIKAPGVVSNDIPEEEDPVAKYLNSMKAETSSDNGYADYARTNEYCVACHKERPPGHNDEWPFIHGQEADRSQDKCLVCHSPRTDVRGTTQKAACSSCHPSIHKTPWRDAHPIEVPQRYGKLEAKCFSCHVRDMCIGCHGTTEPKSENKPPVNTPADNNPPDNKPPTLPDVNVTITPQSKK